MVKKIFEVYMFAIGIAGQLVFYLQLYKIIIAKSAQDVSLVGFSFGLLSVTSWLIYGIVIKNRVLIFANTFAVVGALSVTIAILVYQTK